MGLRRTRRATCDHEKVIVTSHGLRRVSRRGALPENTLTAGEDRAIEFAWRVHMAQVFWANNADVKASILLALEGGALYAVISSLGDGGLLARLGGRPYPVASAIGIFALLLAIAAAAIAVFPRLRKKDEGRDRHRQVIYFGDLRHWKAAELSSHIAGLAKGEELDVLSRQLTEMSKHNWVKHRWVQISLILSLAGILSMVVSAVAALKGRPWLARETEALVDQIQMTCSNAECDGVVLTSDRFCGTCGTPAPEVRRLEPWPGAADGTAAPLSEEPFFSHEPRRPPGPLNSATRYLCAAAYLNRDFANRVIGHLLATRRAVAPSVNFDAGPVLRHCLRARRNILIRDVVLMVIVLAGLIVKTLPTLDFLLFAVSLGVLRPNARRGHGRRIGTVLFALGTLAGVALAVGFMAFLVLGSFPSTLTAGGSLASGTVDFGPVLTFVLLGAATCVTEFVYLRTTFRTLDEDLRRGTESPRAVSGAAEERIAMVEGAQWGNVTLHSGWFPFIGAGLQTEVHWQIAIRLRHKDPISQRLGKLSMDDEHVPTDKYVPIDPVDLHLRIRERLLALNDPALPPNERIGALTVTDRVVGSGLLSVGNPLLDADLKTPYSHASREAVEALIRHPQARVRYYQQVSVNDEGPAVVSRGRKVVEGVDQEVAVSAFVYAAVEGRMFYLQFVLTALPPIDQAYRVSAFRYGTSIAGTLMYSTKRLFGSIASAPAGIYAAIRLRHTERQMEKTYLSAAGGDFGTEISIRQMASAPSFSSYIEELDAEKYNKMISRLLLETVQEYLDSKGVDTSAFGNSAQTIINNGDFNYIQENNAPIDQFGGRGNTHN
jgi:hypothetical protein